MMHQIETMRHTWRIVSWERRMMIDFLRFFLNAKEVIEIIDVLGL
jgi:hypothetical protein